MSELVHVKLSASLIICINHITGLALNFSVVQLHWRGLYLFWMVPITNKLAHVGVPVTLRPHSK